MRYINTCNIADRYLEYLQQDQNQLPGKKYIYVSFLKDESNLSQKISEV